MDNITHSLVGLSVGAAGISKFESKHGPLSRVARTTFCAVSVLANNVPDLDLSYVSITAGKLGSLLHHRGHTHTLGLVLPQAMLVLFVAWVFLRWKKIELERSHWRYLGALAFLGVTTHILFDWFNEYGVHPWWPLSNHWHYADTLFIIEPLIWLTAAAPLIVFSKSEWLKATLWFIVSIAFIAGKTSGYIPTQNLVALALWFFALFFISKKIPLSRLPVFALSSIVFVIFSFALSSRASKNTIRAWHAQSGQKTHLLDVIVRPFPANPFCWMTYLVETDLSKKEYFLTAGTIATYPTVVGVDFCSSPFNDRTINFRPRNDAPKQMRFEGQYSGSLAYLNELAKTNCHVSAMLRFTRAPFYQDVGDEILVGDLRYDFDSKLAFAETLLPKSPKKCPRFIPPWIAPRQDLLSD